ncbi:MAG: hypothetical protein CMM93_05795 [Rickettsiales bacterium]|nr:hypothetical protein [Rickettsiales bacterium]|tara:strand:- start:3766 stop:5097 length:1332 start_codon:yes stop_codon:yes gene_type:complete
MIPLGHLLRLYREPVLILLTGTLLTFGLFFYLLHLNMEHRRSTFQAGAASFARTLHYALSASNQLGLLNEAKMLTPLITAEQELNDRFNESNIYLFDITGKRPRFLESVLSDKDPFVQEIYNPLHYDQMLGRAPYSYRYILQLPDRRWELVFLPTLSSGGKTPIFYPVIVLILGLGITVLFAIFVFQQVTQNLRINELVTQRTGELQDANIQLARINEELEQFAYIASHDLKAPLRAISNIAGWLKKDLADKLDKENLDDIDLLLGRVKRMEILLNDLLAYSRAGRSIDYKNINWIGADALVEDVKLLENWPSDYRLVIAPELGNIQIPVMPLKQIFHNLLSNAIKHHDKSRATIEVKMEWKPELIQFSVVDDGPGIDPRYHEKIFDMFQTLKPRDVVEGSGIGLALIRKLLHEVGCDIQVISEPDDGTCFSFTWPKKLTRVY